MNRTTSDVKDLASKFFLLKNTDPAELVLRLSVLLLVVASDKSPVLFALGLAACGVTFFLPELLRRPAFWFTIAAVQATRNIAAWTTVDDHIILVNYWCLAIGLSLLSPQPLDNLSLNGRLLIGLTFLFAALWKTTSTEYMDSSFFKYCLLLDDRFLYVTKALGGLTNTQLAENYSMVARLREPTSSLTEVALHSSTTIDLLSMFLTWWTLAIEWTMALAFLMGSRTILAPVRNLVLLLFAASTYVVVPVGGFGTTLMVLGFAQSEDAQPRARKALVIGFYALVLYIPLWRLVCYRI